MTDKIIKPAVAIATAGIIGATSISTSAKVHELPKLRYAMNALAPIISQTTMDLHYGKHLATYIANLNKLIAGTDFESMELEEIVRLSDGALFNNAAQTWNHNFYFESFSPANTIKSHSAIGELAKAIDKQWGSFDKFVEDFSAQSLTLFGSGWIWLVSNEKGELSIVKLPNAENPLKSDKTPILGFDVWEHAYYVDYQNRRADHIKALWTIVDWDIVSLRYK